MSVFLNTQLASEAQMDGENIRRMFYLFLNEFQAKNAEGNVVYFYREEAYNMMRNKRTTMNINFRHLMERDSSLTEAISSGFYK
jgi:DNA replicative helicase MCM subunit Mcm2 (Cdc46/Mcm family)